MKRCPNCGAPIERRDDTHCAYCGSPLQDDTQQTTYQPQPRHRSKAEELDEKVRFCRALSIASLVFFAFFIVAAIAMVTAGSIINDPSASDEQKRSAKTSFKIAAASIIIVLVMIATGTIFQIFYSPIPGQI